MVRTTQAMQTDQPDHTDDDWKLLDKDEMDPNQLQPKPPFAHTSKLTLLSKDTQTRGYSGTKILTNEEGWEVFGHIKPTITDKVSDTPKETKVEADKPNTDDQWDMIAHDNTRFILSQLQESICFLSKGATHKLPITPTHRQYPITIYTAVQLPKSSDWFPTHQPDIRHLIRAALNPD